VRSQLRAANRVGRPVLHGGDNAVIKRDTEYELLEQGYKKYCGEKIDIFFCEDLCQRAGVCLYRCPSVFDRNRHPWIMPDQSEVIRIVAAVDKCPTGALQYIIKE
jgi:uncharacterized Fe-S cluster protein YjdI